MNNLAKSFIVIGIGLILIGVMVFIFQKLNIPIGRLPGDVIIRKEKFSFYFPITTCVVASIALSIIFYLFRK